MTSVEAPKRVFDLSALAAGDVEWTPWRQGVDICRLYGDERSGRSAALLRYAPNAEVPLHEHDGTSTSSCSPGPRRTRPASTGPARWW